MEQNTGVNGISLWSPKGSTSGQRSVEQPSCLSQRILDLREVANAHHLENQPVDVGFEFIQPTFRTSDPSFLRISILPSI